ncbi:hypothetical protein LKO27_10240 [Tessaracoccus sp. OS52]|uniref:hypothetical protein n=1 Tax=Tessaracoccus sp. OS52 TaxID=2886691 RepID=UPI001D1138F1|nr:hypothetical protein [Tessaracoccus sp. OS52]MCC2593784.1 hypothetical protein [Tessaracoccus sp. OS52]
MIDDELSAALRTLREANHEALFDPARRGPGTVPTGADRFLAHYGTQRGHKLLEGVQEVWQEARRVPDPGGPITGYGLELRKWAATRPDIDPRALQEIIDRLMFQNR